jgi:transaldolase
MMGKSRIEELSELGQSVWLDYISRSLIESGRLGELVNLGLRGVTSNPSIFDKAISGGTDYDEGINRLRRAGKSAFEIYDELTVKDIRDAADIFGDVYKRTGGLDGYVSLEVSPKLASMTEETVAEAKRLRRKVDRPNLMIKVPATPEGFGAVEELTSSGVNVNVTLIFSLDQYEKAAGAYIKGIGRFIDSGGDASGVRSVASVFISRIDTAVDRMLSGVGAKHLEGKAAVANTALIYGRFLGILSSPEFLGLNSKGANMQRVLWGSTSTKNPAYSDIKYVTELICRDSVNTIPQKTLDAFMDHGIVKEALTGEVARHKEALEELKRLGIDIDAVCLRLLEEGVSAFNRSFDSLLRSIKDKTKTFCNT